MLAALGCRVAASVEHDAAPAAEAEARAPKPEALFVDLFVAPDYGCALAYDGRVWCWGGDPGLALGLRPPTQAWQQASPLADLEGVVAIDGDYLRTCAVLADGQVRCWQRQDPRNGESFSPELVPGIFDAVDVAVAGGVCVRTRSGEIHCSSIRGERRRQVASHAIDFAIGWGRACALDAEGGVWCWDGFARYIAESPEPWAGTLEWGPNGELLMARLPGAVEIAVGDTEHDVLVRMASGEILLEPQVLPSVALPMTRFLPIDGTTPALALDYRDGHGCMVEAQSERARCFHGNGWAQLGAGDSQAHPEGVVVAGLEGVVDVAVSRSLSCAATRTGVSCWGTRITPRREDVDEPPRVLAIQVASMTVGHSNTCASLLDGRNLCWGATDGEDFERDEAGIFATFLAQPLGLELGRLAGNEGPCFYDQAGVMLWGAPPTTSFFGAYEVELRREGVSACVDANGPCYLQAGALICEDFAEHRRALPRLRKPTAIAASGDFLCVAHDGGKVACMPIPALDDEVDVSTLPAPVMVEILDLADTVQLLGDGGPTHCFVALGRSGDARVFCVLEHVGGHQVRDLGPLSIGPADQLVYTRTGVCGLTRTGKIMCESFRGREVETHELPNTVAIAGAGFHWCALSSDHTLTCMGDNSFGQLGVVPKTVIATPLAIEFE